MFILGFFKANATDLLALSEIKFGVDQSCTSEIIIEFSYGKVHIIAVSCNK